MYYRRGGRRWHRSRYSRRRSRTPTAWFELGNNSLTQLTGGTLETSQVLMSGRNIDRRYVSTGPTTQLDWGGRSPLVERIVLCVVLTVTNTLVKKLIRYWFGLRITEVDINGNLPTAANSPSLAMADAPSKMEDWLYFGEACCSPSGVAADYSVFEYRGSKQIIVDIKPRRHIDLEKALVFQQRWANQDNTAPDATFGGTMSGRILIAQRWNT